MTKYYLITAAQNSTPVHRAFWRNLLAYQRWLGAELLVGRFVYNVCRPGEKVADARVRTDAVYAPEIPIQPAQRRQLTKGLVWCPEMNILPTAVRPLSGLEIYGRGSSTIFPHAKLALESIPTGKGERTLFSYTTGTCTLPNYIEKKAGLKAQFHHTQCALIVEVAADGRWWVRQLNADSDGVICDLTITVSNGHVKEGRSIRTVSWGDIHASELTPEIRDMNWKAEAGIIDWLRPEYQFMHDLLSFRSASHHDAKSFAKRFECWRAGWTVNREIQLTGRLLRLAHRPWCQTVVVNSNHDMHPDRWLDDADYRQDLPNAEIFLEAQLARIRARGKAWAFLPWAMKRVHGGPARFLAPDESFVLDNIQYGWHGHKGPNGSRGSTQNLAKTNSKATKGHDHRATIFEGVFSGGVCALDQAYATGPGSWSISHVVEYENTKRAIITVHGDEPWADFK